MTTPAMIARCPRCNTTAPIERMRHIFSNDLVHTFAPHGECKGGIEAGEVLEDTPANREALALKWIGEDICPECLQRPVRRRGLCGSCADLRERQRFSYREPVRRNRMRGRR